MRSLLLAAFALGAKGLENPISAENMLPPDSYSSSTAVTDTNAEDQINSLETIKSPSYVDESEAFKREIAIRNTGSSGSSESSDADSSESTTSVTAQDVADGMDLGTCIDHLGNSDAQYQAFSQVIDSIQTSVGRAGVKLDKIDVLTHNIEVKQDSFEGELKRLKDLYNTIAVRANAIGKWMGDEKVIRDALQALYRLMVTKNNEEEQKLGTMTANLAAASSKVAKVDSETTNILADVMTTQSAMYDWAVDVTNAINAHTTKIDSLQAAVQFRISQIDNVIAEMRNMAERTIFIARSLGETNMAYFASNVLTHVQSVLNTADGLGSMISIPTR